MDLQELPNFLFDIPFTEITGQYIGDATTRYFMQYGKFKLKRIEYTPYGSTSIPATWDLDNTIISDLTLENGNAIARFLEDKWRIETNGKTIIITR